MVSWTLQWYFGERSQRHQVNQRLASLLSPEVQLGLENRPFLAGPALSQLSQDDRFQSVRLRSSDNSILWSTGTADSYDTSGTVVESGQYLASLDLQWKPLLPPPVLVLAWVVYALSLLGLRGTPSAPSSRSLVLELDDQRRIRRLTGDVGLLAHQGDLLGRPLDEVLYGSADASRSHSQLSSASGRSLVVVRDSQDIRKVRQRLQQLELHYRGLCDRAHDMILIAQPEGGLIFCNRSLQSRLGSPLPGELLQLFSPDCHEQVLTQLHNALLEGSTPEFEVRMVVAGNLSIPVLGNFSSTRQEDGSPLTVLGIFHDISAQRKAEASLVQAQKMEAVGLLAGGVAHDFNNFLAVFSALTSLIQADLEEPALVEGYIEDIQRAVESAAELTRQLLQFTRAKAPTRETFAVDVAVAEIARMASRILGRGIELKVDLQASVELLSDRSQLEQVVLNLLVNARDASPESGEIELSTRLEGNWVVLRVSDRGCGMDAETLSRIFDPYFTTKAPGKGTGLGLSTLYAIVSGWQGQVQVESEPGKGTTFTVRIPTS